MHTLEPILRDHPFFKDLKDEYIHLLVGCAGNVVFQPDQFIYHEGGSADKLYVVREGEVALEIFGPGRAPTVVETLGAGDILGWSSLIPPYHAQFSAQAMERTRAIAFDATCIRNKFEADHDLGYELLKRVTAVMLSRLQSTRLLLLDIYGSTP